MLQNFLNINIIVSMANLQEYFWKMLWEMCERSDGRE